MLAAADTTATLAAIASVITAIAVLLTSVASLRNQRRTLRHVKTVDQKVQVVNQKVQAVDSKIAAVHDEVQTANGITMAALADRQEGRRIASDIPKSERTTSEQGYVDNLERGGRNVGHTATDDIQHPPDKDL